MISQPLTSNGFYVPRIACEFSMVGWDSEDSCVRERAVSPPPLFPGDIEGLHLLWERGLLMVRMDGK